MTLGDVLLSRGDVWTSELLYAQVEKDFTEEEMGQFAKFKRAELSFFVAILIGLVCNSKY